MESVLWDERTGQLPGQLPMELFWTPSGVPLLDLFVVPPLAPSLLCHEDGFFTKINPAAMRFPSPACGKLPALTPANPLDTFCQNGISSTLGGPVQGFLNEWAEADALQVMGQREQLEEPCDPLGMAFRSDGGRQHAAVAEVASLGSGSCALSGSIGGSLSGSGSGSISDHEGQQGATLKESGNENSGEQVPPNERKRLRRMFSNRESAKRSRLRRQELLHNLEVQVAELRVEKIALMKKVDTHARQSSVQAEENKLLKAEVLDLRKQLMDAIQCAARRRVSLSEPASSKDNSSPCGNSRLPEAICTLVS